LNPFIIEEVAQTTTQLSPRHFPLARAESLRNSFAHLFSRHLGHLRSGHFFEPEALRVIGLSGSGKTRELNELIAQFNDSAAPLPSGQPARIAQCILDSKGGWKDLGKKTLHALGYPIKNASRLTQSDIWARVMFHAKAQGVVGIQYDEAQHIFRGKSENERDDIRDAFKTLMKKQDWPLMLILSGVPELETYVSEEQQLFRMTTLVRFNDIDLTPSGSALAEDYETIHQIVGSFALEAGLKHDPEILNQDFYHRLATAAAFRWGILFDLVFLAALKAASAKASSLAREHFIEAWVTKTGMNPAATPFTHTGYVTMFPRERPFQAAI